MFKQRMEYSKLKTGFGPACFKVAAGMHNYRFLTNATKVMDLNPKSFLPNLKRALIMKSFENECDPTFENHFLPALKKYHNQLLKFGATHGWININDDNYDELNFPPVTVELNQADLFDDLLDNNVFWCSVGPYIVKTAAFYLNQTTYEHKYFESQYLDPNSKLYLDLQREFFPGKSTTILRLRIPSSHKPAGFNAKGYKVYIGFNKILNYNSHEPEVFEVENVRLPSVSILRNEPNYYFKYSLEFTICTCRSGRRTMGVCSHRMAAILFFGTDVNFNRTVYRALDGSSYRPVYTRVPAEPEVDEPEVL